MNASQKTIFNAFIAVAVLLTLYFVLVSAISGPAFALSQFSTYWYFLIALALGFGTQIGLYSYLKKLVSDMNMAMPAGTSGHSGVPGKTVAVTGTTSTLSMISCCAHYLANIVPILGIAGALSAVAAYQVEIFWIGLAFNLFGIAFIGNKIRIFKKHHV